MFGIFHIKISMAIEMEKKNQFKWLKSIKNVREKTARQ